MEAPKDELGRKSFAEGVADFINVRSSKECFVIGIEGAWGEGKTYTIDLIRRRIEELNKQAIEEKKPVIKWIVFNPWSFKDHEHLAEMFLNLLSQSIVPKRSRLLRITSQIPKFLKPLGIKLLRLELLFRLGVTLLALLLAIWKYTAPYLGFSVPVLLALSNISILRVFKNKSDIFLHDLAGFLDEYAKGIEYFEKRSGTKSLVELKDEVIKKLADDKFPYSKIVVAIEDLDRLTPQEIQSVLQLMKMIADFPRIVYLLAYDHNQVSRALDKISGTKTEGEEALEYGRGYLKKIVQAAYKLPAAKNGSILAVILEPFIESAKVFYGADFQQSPRWQSVMPIMAELWPTVRDGERVVQRAIMIVTMLKEKSNPTDVLAAAYLMQDQSTLWSWVENNKDSVLNGGTDIFNKNNNVDYTDQINGVDSVKGHVKDLMELIFPSLKESNSHYFSLEERKQFPIGCSDYMQGYFRYEVSPAANIQSLIPHLISSKDSERQEALKEIKPRGGDVLTFIFRDLSRWIDESQLDWGTQSFPLLRDLGEIYDSRQDDSAFKYPLLNVISLTIRILNKIPGNQRTDAFFELIAWWLENDCRFLVMSLAEEAALENDRISQDDIRSRQNPIQITLSEAEWARLIKMVEEKIEGWVRSSPSEWLKHPYAGPMLFAWLRLSPEKARVKIDEWMKDDWNTLYVLNTMMHRGVLLLTGLKRLTNKDVLTLKQRVQEISEKSPSVIDSDPVFQNIIQQVQELKD